MTDIDPTTLLLALAAMLATIVIGMWLGDQLLRWQWRRWWGERDDDE